MIRHDLSDGAVTVTAATRNVRYRIDMFASGASVGCIVAGRGGNVKGIMRDKFIRD